MATIRECEQDVRDEVRERAAELRESAYPEDTLSEIADSGVPIYTYDLMSMAADDLSLATDEPELGPAFDGSPTPVNIVAGNVYDRLTQAAYAEWEAVKDEDDEDEADEA